MFKERFMVFKKEKSDESPSKSEKKDKKPSFLDSSKEFLSKTGEVVKSVREKAEKDREAEKAKAIAERSEMYASISEELVPEHVNVYEKSTEVLLALGTDDMEKVHFALADDSNPYSIRFMDSVEQLMKSGYEFDLKATKEKRLVCYRKKGEKTVSFLRNAERVLSWRKIYPPLKAAIEKHGYKYDDACQVAVSKVAHDYINYPYFDTFAGVATHLGVRVSEEITLNMMIELVKAAGIKDVSPLEQRLAELNGKKEGGSEGELAPEEKKKYEVSEEEVGRVSNYELIDGVYYNSDGTPCSPEKVARIKKQEEQRRLVEDKKALEAAKKEFFSEEQTKFDDMVKTVRDPEPMDREMFDSFAGEMLPLIDEILQKEPRLNEFHDSFIEMAEKVGVSLFTGKGIEAGEALNIAWDESFNEFMDSLEYDDYKGRAGAELYRESSRAVLDTMKRFAINAMSHGTQQ